MGLLTPVEINKAQSIPPVTDVASKICHDKAVGIGASCDKIA